MCSRSNYASVFVVFCLTGKQLRRDRCLLGGVLFLVLLELVEARSDFSVREVIKGRNTAGRRHAIKTGVGKRTVEVKF